MPRNKPQRKKQARVPWRTSEILYAVMGYLSTREQPLIFSGNHHPGPIAEILGAIVQANGLPAPRGRYPKIKIPDGLEGITNVPHVVNACSEGPEKRPVNEVDGFISHLRRMKPEEQNETIKAIISEMWKFKHTRLDSAEQDEKQIVEEVHRRRQDIEKFRAIINGNV